MKRRWRVLVSHYVPSVGTFTATRTWRWRWLADLDVWILSLWQDPEVQVRVFEVFEMERR